MNKIHNGYINIFLSLDKFQIDKTNKGKKPAINLNVNGLRKFRIVNKIIICMII